MPCDTIIPRDMTLEQRQAQITRALARLEAYLKSGVVRVVIDKRTGALTLAGWSDSDRDGVTDACAYRALTLQNSATMRMAIARAEQIQGVKLNPNAVAAGVHSHDGGKTWTKH